MGSGALNSGNNEIGGVVDEIPVRDHSNQRPVN